MSETDSAKILRTPDDRFENLPDFPYRPHYLDGLPGFAGVRVHYLDEPGAGAPPAAPEFDGDLSEAALAAAAQWTRPDTILCLHGHPTWSFLYRRMIPIMTGQGYRVVVPDLPGFGKSDKPVDEGAYSIESLRAAVIGFIEALDLRNLIVVGHDWGAMLALTLPMAMQERIKALVIMNCALPTGDRRLADGVIGWRTYNQNNPDLNVPGLMAKANRILTFGECRAYGAPFPDVTYKAAVRALPASIPEDVDAPGAELMRETRQYLTDQWDGASQIIVGPRDPVHGHSSMRALHGQIRGCPEPIMLEHAGHFVPEWGDEFADAMLRSIELQIDEKRYAAIAEADAPPPDVASDVGATDAATDIAGDGASA